MIVKAVSVVAGKGMYTVHRQRHEAQNWEAELVIDLLNAPRTWGMVI